MRRDKRQSAQRELIERNLALRARARRLCEAARLLREIAERARSESRRLKDSNARLALQLEGEAAPRPFEPLVAHTPAAAAPLKSAPLSPSSKKPPGALSPRRAETTGEPSTLPLTAFPRRGHRGNCYAVSSDARRLAPRCSKKLSPLGSQLSALFRRKSPAFKLGPRQPPKPAAESGGLRVLIFHNARPDRRRRLPSPPSCRRRARRGSGACSSPVAARSGRRRPSAG